MSKMPAKKKSCFQITSVTTAQVATSITEDTESLDDPDESRTEDVSSEIFDVSRATDFGPEEACERSSSEETLNNVGDAETPGAVSPNLPLDGQLAAAAAAAAAAAPGPAPANGGGAAAGRSASGVPAAQQQQQQPAATCSSRFRVIKLDHGSGEPYRRGRWTCVEYYERDPDSGVLARSADCIRHGSASEPAAERDSGLGATGGSVVAAAASDPGTDSSQPPPAEKTSQPGPAPPPFGLGPPLGGAAAPGPTPLPPLFPAAPGSGTPAAPPGAGLPLTTVPLAQPGLPLPLPLPPQAGPAGGAPTAPPPPPFAYPPPGHVLTVPPAGPGEFLQPPSPAQPGDPLAAAAGPPGLLPAGAGPPPSVPAPPLGAGGLPPAAPGVANVPAAAPAPSVPSGPPAPLAMPSAPADRGPFPPLGPADGARRTSEPLPQPPPALLDPKPAADGPAAPLHLAPVHSLATSVLGIALPVDGEEDRNPSAAFYQAFHLNTFQESKNLWDSASGGGGVAIDNKIEQAMDLVKSHLMYAVREEVEVLKEQIKELVERNSLLERENALLKSLSNNDQLSQLPAQQANPGSNSQQQAVSARPPPQPDVSSA